MRTLILPAVAAALLLASCSSAPRNATADRSVRIEYTRDVPGVRDPAGWIYASGRGASGKDLCVYVWGNRQWTLSSETSPGWYGTRIAEGAIDPAGTLTGFPVNILDPAKNVYTAGAVQAWKDGTPILSHSVN